MIVRHWARFETDLPSEAIEPEGMGDFIQFGGRPVAAALAEMLRARGCKVEPPEHGGEHGWYLAIKTADGRRVWGQVTDLDYYLLMLEDQAAGGASRHPAYLDLLKGLHADLSADPRFRNLRWFTQQELDAEGPEDTVGAAEPVAGEAAAATSGPRAPAGPPSPAPDGDKDGGFLARLLAALGIGRR